MQKQSRPTSCTEYQSDVFHGLIHKKKFTDHQLISGLSYKSASCLETGARRDKHQSLCLSCLSVSEAKALWGVSQGSRG